MLNRSEIFRSAWAAYRIRRQVLWTGDNRFLRDVFAAALRAAWAGAKKVAEQSKTAEAFLAAERRVQTAAVAAMEPMARSARLTAIRDELQVLDYAPLGVRTSQRRMNLNAELQLLTA